MGRILKSLVGAAFAVASICSTSQVSYASASNMGFVTQVIPTFNGAVLFTTTGPRVGTHPTCQGPGLDGRYAIDASTVAGQALVAVLLTAKAQGKRIYIQGTGTCTIWGDTETVAHFLVED